MKLTPVLRALVSYPDLPSAIKQPTAVQYQLASDLGCISQAALCPPKLSDPSTLRSFCMMPKSSVTGPDGLPADQGKYYHARGISVRTCHITAPYRTYHTVNNQYNVQY